MRADIHHGPEHKLHKEAGYISARPNLVISESLLRCTAGPYIWVTTELAFLRTADERARPYKAICNQS
jgi:hypothetical protein